MKVKCEYVTCGIFLLSDCSLYLGKLILPMCMKCYKVLISQERDDMCVLCHVEFGTRNHEITAYYIAAVCIVCTVRIVCTVYSVYYVL